MGRGESETMERRNKKETREKPQETVAQGVKVSSLDKAWERREAFSSQRTLQ